MAVHLVVSKAACLDAHWAARSVAYLVVHWAANWVANWADAMAACLVGRSAVRTVGKKAAA